MARHESFKAAATAIEQARRHGHVSNQREYVSAEVAAAHLGYKNVRSLYKAIPTQGIPCYRRGSRTLRFVLAELDQWMAGARVLHGESLAAGKR